MADAVANRAPARRPGVPLLRRCPNPGPNSLVAIFCCSTGVGPCSLGDQRPRQTVEQIARVILFEIVNARPPRLVATTLAPLCAQAGVSMPDC